MNLKANALKIYNFIFPKCSKRREFAHGIVQAYRDWKYEPWTVRSDKKMHSLIKKRAAYRKRGRFYDDESERLSLFKDIHKGARCFIVCTGPSLKIEDLEKLKGEYTIGVNSIIDAYSKTDWRPTYYCVTDHYAFKSHLKDREVEGGAYALKNSFFHFRIEEKHAGEDNFHLPVSCENHKKSNLKKGNIVLSDDISVCVYDAFTVAASAVQIAVYMGFKEIYFIGADNNYTKDSRHFSESEMNDNQLGTEDFSDIVTLARRGFSACAEFAGKRGVKIYNATRGGKLEVFERVDLDVII